MWPMVSTEPQLEAPYNRWLQTEAIVATKDADKYKLLAQLYQFQDFHSFMDNNFKSWVDYQLEWFIANMEAIKG